jgi:pimeloyl-ACP methyl ester carboxylesterase
MSYVIDEKRDIQLGGVTQNIRIRTCDAALPVLLFLHGGPGVCDRHWVLKYQSGLSDCATLVCWDQRGAGQSYDKKADIEALTVERLVEDAAELCVYLKERFQKEKILIVGHSWGSLLGVLLTQKYPQHIAAYIGMGQFVDGPENETLSYQFVLDEAQKRNDQKALADLARIGWPVDGLYKSHDDMMVQRDYMTKYGGGDYGSTDGIIKSVVIPLIKSPEYRLTQLLQYNNGCFSSLKKLWSEVVSFHLCEDVPELKVPVYLTEGRHDYNTPIPVAQRWYEGLKAPHKDWSWFEQAAHSPIKEMTEEWGAAVRGNIEKTTA